MQARPCGTEGPQNLSHPPSTFTPNSSLSEGWDLEDLLFVSFHLCPFKGKGRVVISKSLALLSTSLTQKGVFISRPSGTGLEKGFSPICAELASEPVPSPLRLALNSYIPLAFLPLPGRKEGLGCSRNGCSCLKTPVSFPDSGSVGA